MLLRQGPKVERCWDFFIKITALNKTVKADSKVTVKPLAVLPSDIFFLCLYFQYLNKVTRLTELSLPCCAHSDSPDLSGKREIRTDTSTSGQTLVLRGVMSSVFITLDTLLCVPCMAFTGHWPCVCVCVCVSVHVTVWLFLPTMLTGVSYSSTVRLWGFSCLFLGGWGERGMLVSP